MGIMGWFVIVVLTVALCMLCYKLGQKMAWDYIAQNYIAIHKTAVIGPILIKKNTKEIKEKNHAKNKSKRAGKKTSK